MRSNRKQVVCKPKIKFTEEQYNLFIQIHNIADIIYNSSNNPGVDQRNSVPDYECVQTRSGVLLEQSNILHTPWGKWEIMSENSTVIFDESDITIDLFRNSIMTTFGYFNPLYSITHVNGEKITQIEPIDSMDMNKHYLKQLWDKMKAYMELHKNDD